jgi:hypothetical protein
MISSCLDLDHQFPPLYKQPFEIAYAQEEEEEEEEEESKDEEKEEEEEEEGEESKEEESSEEEPQNESSATQVPDIIENINQEAQTLVQQEQQIEVGKEEVKNTLNELLNPQLPPLLANLTNDHITNAAPPNDCNCTVVQPPTPTPTPPVVTGLEQIILSNRIIDYKVLGGSITDPRYTTHFGLKNAFDNIINNTSYWSQSGKVGFTITLDRPLSEYEVCSASIDVYKARNIPFTLKIGTAPDYNGVLDSLSKNIVLDKCITNVNSVSMYFDSGKDFTSLAEIKLFGKRLANLSPPVQTPVLPSLPENMPVLEPNTSAGQKIEIKDSTAEINIKNSTVTFKFDPLTATFVGQPAN